MSASKTTETRSRRLNKVVYVNAGFLLICVEQDENRRRVCVAVVLESVSASTSKARTRTCTTR